MLPIGAHLWKLKNTNLNDVATVLVARDWEGQGVSTERA